jgi:hypothetical protein
VLFGRHHGGSGGSGSPVVRSVGSHRSSRSCVSESGRYHLDKCRKSISILFSRLGKSADHDKNRKMGGHMSKKRRDRLYIVFICVMCQWSTFFWVHSHFSW